MSASSFLRDFTLGVLVPALVVGAGVAAFFVLGEAVPQKVAPIGEDYASQLAILPEAEVHPVRSFADAKDELDIELTGTVVPFRELSIASEVSGRIVFKDPNCRPGRYVTAGQLLFKIDPRDYELEVQRLGKMRDQDYASIRELEQEIANAQRLIEVSTQDLELQEAEIKRLTSLPAGIASQTEVDAAKRSRLQSLNQQVGWQNQLELAKSRRVRLEAAEQLATTQLEKAKLDLARCEIRSPVDGVIATEQAELDSFVQRGSPLVTIEDTSNVEVACSLRMDQLYWILDQDNARAEAGSDLTSAVNSAGRYALPPTPVTLQFRVAGREQQAYQWEGVLSRYEGSGLDPQSRTVPCRVRVEKPYLYKINGQTHEDDRVSGPPALVRGMFVDVHVHAQPTTPLLLVPKLAVKPGSVVWKFVPDTTVVGSGKSSASTKAEDAAKDAAKNTGSAKAAENAKKSEIAKAPDTKSDAPAFDPNQWSPGRLMVLENIQVIRPYSLPSVVDGGPAQEYWVCEAREDQLRSGEMVVVTPLAAVRGDGSEGIRVPNGDAKPTTPASPAQPAAPSKPVEQTASKTSEVEAG